MRLKPPRPALAVVLAIACLAATLGWAPSASASTSTLCTGYAACRSAGMSDAGYSSHSRTQYWRMYGGHNCTNYIAYRMTKAGVPRPDGGGTARLWGANARKAGYAVDGRAAVGAIAWWDGKTAGGGSAGHLAYVEKVENSTTIRVSEDNYGGNFHWKRITKSGKGWPSGFIHFKDAVKMPAYQGTRLSQAAWTDQTKKTALVANEVRPGQRAYVEVKYANNGRTTWKGVQLGTRAPTNHASPLASGWISRTRAARQREASVAQGKIATFAFWVQVPKNAKPAQAWSEQLMPVQPGVTWIPAETTVLKVAVPHSLAAVPLGRQVYTSATKKVTVDPNRLSPGQRVYVRLRFRNSGLRSWSRASLGTRTPTNHASRLAHEWASASRTGTTTQATVPAGSNAAYEFWVRIPTSAKVGSTWLERLRPVQPGVAWMSGADAVLSLRAAVKAPATVTAKLPSKTTTTAKRPTVDVAMTAQGIIPTGRLTAMVGKTKVGTATLTASHRGRLRVSMRALQKGTKKVRVVYGGNSKVTSRTSNTVTLTVLR